MLPALAGELSRSGASCRIATLVGERFGTPPDVAGVEVLRFTPNASSKLGRSREFSQAVEALVRDANVVHLHGLWTGQNWAAGAAARKLGRPYIMTPHSMMMPWAWQRSWWKKRPIGWLFEHENLRQAACLHALAEGEAKAIRALGFNKHIEIVPNGIHAAEFSDLPAADELIARWPVLREPKWLLFLGRIHPQKGVVQAMQAGFDILASADDWHLVIAGPDEVGMRSMLEAAITRKGLAHRVTFTGMLDRREVLACLGRASLLIQPSMSEGLSMSIIEALAAGLPVLISTACNLPEVVEAQAGRVVEPDRRLVAKALREMIALKDETLQEMGRNGRRLATERYDWSRLIGPYLQMYTRVAKA